MTEAEEERLQEAVALCLDLVNDGWQGVVIDRAEECLTPQTWGALFGERRMADCRALAELAQAILDGKQKLHDLIGWVAAQSAKYLGAGHIERVAAQELAKRFPLPGIDDQATVVARGLQMLGIALCLSGGTPLSQCQSFIDLALNETKDRVKQLMTTALEEWVDGNAHLVKVWGGDREVTGASI